MVHKVNSGHPGGSLGCTEFMVTLFNSEMKRNKNFSMDGVDEDLFFCFSYNLKTYNNKRNWNNPEGWANPENFDKYRW